jgi:hypothetical protein
MPGATNVIRKNMESSKDATVKDSGKIRYKDKVTSITVINARVK